MSIFGKSMQSTKNVTVFGQGSEKQLDKDILLARAKREQHVQQFLEKATDTTKDDFRKAFTSLVEAINFHLSISERLHLFIDNSVLQDILHKDDEQQDKSAIRYHALLAFLHLAEDYYCLDLFACISPAILYEASHRGRLKLQDVIHDATRQMASVGLRTHFAGFGEQSELPALFKMIRRDEVRILAALNIIKETNWKRDFKSKHGLGVTIPFGIAESECPEVKLEYFSPRVVKFLLMHNIEKKMYHHNPEAPKARRLMVNPQEKEFAVIAPRKSEVEGLGDIELLTYCNLRAQTATDAPNITFGVTFDDGLRNALHLQTGKQKTVTIIGGVDDPEDSALRVVYQMSLEAKRTDKANRRMQERLNELRAFVVKVLDKHL